MILSLVLAGLVALGFMAVGLSKILALAPMRDLAAEAGFSVGAYRVIGGLEVAGAAGVALGLAVPLLGVLAGAGLLLLMAGAVITHGRNGDGLRGMTPALVCAVLVACYLAALILM
ncbi:MAG: DoxX family protein [Streptomyces sp.]|nr:DoxX family protein [Streptomyces sp.]NUP42120.1 DoxX family protein [Streptomyces sp.]